MYGRCKKSGDARGHKMQASFVGSLSLCIRTEQACKEEALRSHLVTAQEQALRLYRTEQSPRRLDIDERAQVVQQLYHENPHPSLGYIISNMVSLKVYSYC